ncbi:MAG: glycosyl transferase [Gemmatimonadetes bacterium]|nr:glycosyl transferase [Gemmatimonadota bacterium]
MNLIALIAVFAPGGMLGYAYVGYPLLLRLASRKRVDGNAVADPRAWPRVTIVISAYNAERTIARTLDPLLAIDYPKELVQILVASDGSTDRTDALVREYANRGVELVRVPRGGKTAAENALAMHVRGEIVVCTDASVIVHPKAVKQLVRRIMSDRRLGVVSGRSIVVDPETLATVEPSDARARGGEGGYSDFEHAVRSLETKFGAIVGATGGLYAQRAELFAIPLPPHVTRDLGCTLVAVEHGYGSAQENDATCVVGSASSLRGEYRRKVRTMINGLDTMWCFRRLLRPSVSGWYAPRLWSHKLARVLAYLLTPLAGLGLVVLAASHWIARIALAGGLAAALLALVAVLLPPTKRAPSIVSMCGYAVAGAIAALEAWWSFFRGKHATVWEPTNRSLELSPDA